MALITSVQPPRCLWLNVSLNKTSCMVENTLEVLRSCSFHTKKVYYIFRIWKRSVFYGWFMYYYNRITRFPYSSAQVRERSDFSKYMSLILILTIAIASSYCSCKTILTRHPATLDHSNKDTKIHKIIFSRFGFKLVP